MLLAREITVGTLADAKPLSLMFPRTQDEATILVGQLDTNLTAVFLDGQHIFRSFKCSTATDWAGLLVPFIRIEVDHKSAFDPNSVAAPLGAVIRVDTLLTINSIPENSFGRRSRIVLESDLPPTVHGLTAGFSKWCVTLGDGQDKRVLLEIDTAKPQ